MVNNDDTGVSYKTIKRRCQMLQLDSLELGFDSFQLRLWYENDLSSNQRVVTLKKRAGGWQATLIKYSINLNDPVDIRRIERKKCLRLVPVNGWDSIEQQLHQLKLITSTDSTNFRITGGGGLGGILYVVEVANTKFYRFYDYLNPGTMQKKEWQASEVTALSNLMQKEFGVIP
jgi:hypothetical protein